MDRNMIFITIQTKGHPSQSRHNEINEILAKKIIRDLNLDSKKLRITSGFKNKLETLIHRIHNSAILYEKLSNQNATFAF